MIDKLAVLFASPLTINVGPGVSIPFDLLDFDHERSRILDSLAESGKAVDVCFAAATTDNFRSILTRGFNIVHYAGHGNVDFLAFEDKVGVAHALSTDVLMQLVKAGGPGPVKLAFVSACESASSGESHASDGPHGTGCNERHTF